MTFITHCSDWEMIISGCGFRSLPLYFASCVLMLQSPCKKRMKCLLKRFLVLKKRRTDCKEWFTIGLCLCSSGKLGEDQTSSSIWPSPSWFNNVFKWNLWQSSPGLFMCTSQKRDSKFSGVQAKEVLLWRNIGTSGTFSESWCDLLSKNQRLWLKLGDSLLWLIGFTREGLMATETLTKLSGVCFFFFLQTSVAPTALWLSRIWLHPLRASLVCSI